MARATVYWKDDTYTHTADVIWIDAIVWVRMVCMYVHVHMQEIAVDSQRQTNH